MLSKLGKSSFGLLLLAVLRYLHLLLWKMALALGVNKMRKYWNDIKSDLPMHLEIVSSFCTQANICIQQLMAVITDGYHCGFAWVSFAAAFCHLLGVVSSYVVNMCGRGRQWRGLQYYSSYTALVLLWFAGFSIYFEHDIRVIAFLFSQLLRMVIDQNTNLMPEYYLLLDGKILPLSLISTGDAINKLKIRDEDSHLVKLDPNSRLKVRDEYAELVKFETNVCQEMVLSVFSIEENIIKFTVKEDQAHLLKLLKEV